jgi:hypothetical protein
MFSGRISEAVAKQIEKKIAENNDLSSLSNSELADLAVEFVGDAPPSNVPRETVIEILSQQPEISAWRSSVKERAIQATKSKITEIASNVDPRMAEMIKQQFGQWLQNSGLSTVEITTQIDTNTDGKISQAELNDFILNLSGTQPPEWVSETLISILDSDQNGVIEVQELWNYLGAIGFDVPTIEQVTNEHEEVQEIQEQTETFEDVELENEESEIDIDKELSSITDIEEEDEVLQSPEITNEVEIEHTQESEEPNPVVSTSIEIGIERLHSTRLHREANSVIDSTSPGECTLMVERVERTLLVMDSYRGGMTTVGLLDNGPYTVSVLFEPEYNEQIEQLEGKKISFIGSLFDWSSGLRQAKLKGKDLQF